MSYDTLTDSEFITGFAKHYRDGSGIAGFAEIATRLDSIAARLRNDATNQSQPTAQGQKQQNVALDFGTLRNANTTRCLKWHPAGLSSWSPSDWLTAAMGELGELASEVKMHNRDRDGLVGNKESITAEERLRRMAKEAADVVIYLDLFCAERDIDLGNAIVQKFNEVSERVGFPDRINL